MAVYRKANSEAFVRVTPVREVGGVELHVIGSRIKIVLRLSDTEWSQLISYGPNKRVPRGQSSLFDQDKP